MAGSSSGKERCRSALWWSATRNSAVRWVVLGVGVLRWLRRLSRLSRRKVKWLLRRLRSDHSRKVSAKDRQLSSTSSIWAIQSPAFEVGERFWRTCSRQTRKRKQFMPWSVKDCSTKVAQRRPLSSRTLTVSAVNYSLASEEPPSSSLWSQRALM